MQTNSNLANYQFNWTNFHSIQRPARPGLRHWQRWLVHIHLGCRHGLKIRMQRFLFFCREARVNFTHASCLVRGSSPQQGTPTQKVILNALKTGQSRNKFITLKHHICPKRPETNQEISIQVSFVLGRQLTCDCGGFAEPELISLLKEKCYVHKRKLIKEKYGRGQTFLYKMEKSVACIQFINRLHGWQWWRGWGGSCWCLANRAPIFQT